MKTSLIVPVAIAAALSLSACGKHDADNGAVVSNEAVLNDETPTDTNVTDANAGDFNSAGLSTADTNPVGNDTAPAGNTQ